MLRHILGLAALGAAALSLAPAGQAQATLFNQFGSPRIASRLGGPTVVGQNVSFVDYSVILSISLRIPTMTQRATVNANSGNGYIQPFPPDGTIIPLAMTSRGTAVFGTVPGRGYIQPFPSDGTLIPLGVSSRGGNGAVSPTVFGRNNIIRPIPFGTPLAFSRTGVK